jgi:hypothetical protein
MAYLAFDDKVILRRQLHAQTGHTKVFRCERRGEIHDSALILGC